MKFWAGLGTLPTTSPVRRPIRPSSRRPHSPVSRPPSTRSIRGRRANPWQRLPLSPARPHPASTRRPRAQPGPITAATAETPAPASRGFHVPHPLSRTRSAKAPSAATGRPTRSRRPLRFALGFAVAAAGGILLLVGIAAATRSMYSDRVVPGVRIGAVDVSGLTHDQVVARLQSSYAYLDSGEVTVTTATGTAKITYEQTGRRPNLDTMVYEAMRVGHTGDPIADTVAMFRSAISGETVPIAVTLDPKAVATEVRQLVSENQPPKDAQATVSSRKLRASARRRRQGHRRSRDFERDRGPPRPTGPAVQLPGRRRVHRPQAHCQRPGRPGGHR